MLIQIELQCSKNYFKISLIQEAEASGNNVRKEPQKQGPKLRKYKYQIFTGNIYSTCNLMQMVAFCKHLLSL